MNIGEERHADVYEDMGCTGKAAMICLLLYIQYLDQKILQTPKISHEGMLIGQGDAISLAICHCENKVEPGQEHTRVSLLVLLALVCSDVKLFESYCSVTGYFLRSLCSLLR